MRADSVCQRQSLTVNHNVSNRGDRRALNHSLRSASSSLTEDDEETIPSRLARRGQRSHPTLTTSLCFFFALEKPPTDSQYSTDVLSTELVGIVRPAKEKSIRR